MRMVDLSDARRSAKPWLPDDDLDVTNGRVVLVRYPGVGPRPACVEHGAMARVDARERIYRCMEDRCGVGARMEPVTLTEKLPTRNWQQIDSVDLGGGTVAVILARNPNHPTPTHGYAV